MDPPASTWMVWPVIKPALSIQTSATAFPMSAGVPIRPIGFHPPSCQSLMAWNAGSGRPLNTLSWVAPGLITLPVMVADTDEEAEGYASKATPVRIRLESGGTFTVFSVEAAEEFGVGLFHPTPDSSLRSE